MNIISSEQTSAAFNYTNSRETASNKNLDLFSFNYNRIPVSNSGPYSHAHTYEKDSKKSTENVDSSHAA